MVISWAWTILDDKARKPESEPKRAVLEEATIYVTGDDGGTSISLGKCGHRNASKVKERKSLGSSNQTLFPTT